MSFWEKKGKVLIPVFLIGKTIFFLYKVPLFTTSSSGNTEEFPTSLDQETSSGLHELSESFTAAYSVPDFELASRPDLNDKQKLIEKIKDYTVKIVFSNVSGTGWFLDYEIPEEGKYPTKWFLATNAHVIDSYPFQENPYKQTLPTSSNHATPLWLYKWETGGYDEEILLHNKLDFEEPKVWAGEEIKKVEHNKAFPPPYRNAETSFVHWDRKKETPLMGVEIKNPKLLYVPLEDVEVFWFIKEKNFKDFAVLEIDFPNEISAKRMTESIYTRSDSEKLDFLSNIDKESELYTAGYPGNSYNPFRAFGNYSKSNDKASENFGCKKAESYDGFFWNKVEYKNPSCYYSLNGMWNKGGSSGSMVVDDKGSLLGLVALGSIYTTTSSIQPIRNLTKDCGYLPYSCRTIVDYDLISGSSRQKSSYKQQILQYFKNSNTYLKQRYKW